MTNTKNKELTKLISGIETAGYQVDSIKMLPEGDFHIERGRCLVYITASPLSPDEVQPSTPPE